MTALTYCLYCDTTVDLDDDHFDEQGDCTIQPIRETLSNAANERGY